MVFRNRLLNLIKKQQMNKPKEKFPNFLSNGLTLKLLIEVRFLDAFEKSFNVFDNFVISVISGLILVLSGLTRGASAVGFIFGFGFPLVGQILNSWLRVVGLRGTLELTRFGILGNILKKFFICYFHFFISLNF
jgi:hypothetical protein